MNKSTDIGIDIEYMDKRINFQEIAYRLFTKEEYYKLMMQNGYEQKIKYLIKFGHQMRAI